MAAGAHPLRDLCARVSAGDDAHLRRCGSVPRVGCGVRGQGFVDVHVRAARESRRRGRAVRAGAAVLHRAVRFRAQAQREMTKKRSASL